MELIKVEDKNGELIVDSRHLAHLFQIQHKNVLELVNKFENELNMLGRVAFETEAVLTKGGTQEIKFCWLSEPQCNLLITFFKNTEIAVRAKLHLIQSFEKAKKIIKTLLNKKANLAWREARQKLQDGFSPMSQAVKESREAQGKEIKPYHYSNEANLICMVLKGMTVTKYKKLHNQGHFRDSLSIEDLAWLNRLQEINTGLLLLDQDRETRKAKLTEFFEKRKHLRLVQPQKQLEKRA